MKIATATALLDFGMSKRVIPLTVQLLLNGACQRLVFLSPVVLETGLKASCELPNKRVHRTFIYYLRLVYYLVVKKRTNLLPLHRSIKCKNTI